MMGEGFIHELCKIQVFFHPFFGEDFSIFFSKYVSLIVPLRQKSFEEPQFHHQKKSCQKPPGLLSLLILLGVVSCTLDSLDDSKFGPTSGMMCGILREHVVPIAYHHVDGGFSGAPECGIGRQHRTLMQQNACSTRTCVFP